MRNRIRQSLRRKSIRELQEEGNASGLHRNLNAIHIVFLGVGCIVGAGIFVLTGTAAANFAGPAVVISFLLAALACGLTGLCYAELASIIPVSGSSYNYCYASLGEGAAWLLAWILIFDYTLAQALVGGGFAAYLVSFLRDFDISIADQVAAPLVDATKSAGQTTFSITNSANLVAAAAIMVAALLLTRGITTSTRINNFLVIVKVSVLILFVLVGLSSINPANWTPFIPENQGGFSFGWEGVFRAASILFFAYLGFETISTAAGEARNPQKDMPIGILGTLGLVTALYLIVAIVLTGIVSYTQLSTSDPIAVALNSIGQDAFSIVIKGGAILGLGSVLLVNAYGQSRICFAVSRDGLLPSFFSRLHSKHASPGLAVLVLGVLSACLAAFLPITILGDLISIGTGFAFSIVCISVIYLRTKFPEIERKFRVPFGGVRVRGVWIGYVPVAAIVLCWVMILPVLIDIFEQARSGHVLPMFILGIWIVAGFLLYFTYGQRPSRRRDALKSS